MEEGSKYTVQSPEKSQDLDYSERTVKTDIIEEENLDDELSDLINNHVSQVTERETCQLRRKKANNSLFKVLNSKFS